MSVTLKVRHRPADAKGRRAVKGYYVTFRDPGRSPAVKEVPAETRDRRTAEGRRVEAERAHALGIYDPWTDAPPWRARAGSGLTVEVAVERFIASRTSAPGGRACTPKTVQSYREHLRPLLATLPPGLMLADLSPAHVERYRRGAAAGLRPATLATYARALRVFCEWCRAAVKDGGGGIAPADWMPETSRAAERSLRGRSDDAPRYFTADEITQLVEHARARAAGAPTHGERTQLRPGGEILRAVLPDVVAFAAYTGLRLGEVCALTWGDILRDGHGGEYVRVVSGERHRTKSGASRTVPLYGGAVEAVGRRLALSPDHAPAAPVFPGAHGGPLHGPHLSRHFRELVRTALPTVPGAAPDRRSFHSLRHSFGTMAVGVGVGLYDVQTAMGHASNETTQRYAKLLPRALHDGFRPLGTAARRGDAGGPGAGESGAAGRRA